MLNLRNGGGGGLAQEGSNRGQGRKLNGDPITTTAILILKHFVCKSCENLDKWHCRRNSCKNDQSFITPPHSKKLKKISAANVNKISKNVYIFLWIFFQIWTLISKLRTPKKIMFLACLRCSCGISSSWWSTYIEKVKLQIAFLIITFLNPCDSRADKNNVVGKARRCDVEPTMERKPLAPSSAPFRWIHSRQIDAWISLFSWLKNVRLDFACIALHFLLHWLC